MTCLDWRLRQVFRHSDRRKTRRLAHFTKDGSRRFGRSLCLATYGRIPPATFLAGLGSVSRIFAQRREPAISGSWCVRLLPIFGARRKKHGGGLPAEFHLVAPFSSC